MGAHLLGFLGCLLSFDHLQEIYAVFVRPDLGNRSFLSSGGQFEMNLLEKLEGFSPFVGIFGPSQINPSESKQTDGNQGLSRNRCQIGSTFKRDYLAFALLPV
jgi:hypothetical protein